MNRRDFNHHLLLTLLLAACGADLPGAPESPVAGAAGSNFHRIYDDPALREKFQPFLANVFHLYPEDDFHALILHLTQTYADDQHIYEALLAHLPKLRGVTSTLSYDLPALGVQKRVIAAQAAALLGPDRIDGYLEIGTLGRHVKDLRHALDLQGEVFICNDVEPGGDPVSIAERGGLAKAGDFVPLGAYDPVTAAIPAGSLDLVSNVIGFHHCPDDRLDAFVTSLRDVLRPNGRLVLREHDVTESTMDTFVALAHDVFNAGVGRPWAANAAELRHFRSVADWEALLGSHGFRREPGAQLQTGDPTDNTLLVFRRA